jgi:hypothetical protein
MNVVTRTLLAAGIPLGLAGGSLSAQVLHTNDRWTDCAIVLDASLTQEAWQQFVRELGLVAYVRPLASARPLGAKRFELALLQWSTKLDDADPAWNDTFSHPDSTHWLFDGGALPIPGLLLRIGVTDRLDIGAYFTQNTRANYGIVGGHVQYNLLDDHERKLAAAGRVNVARLFGPDDMTAGVYGLEFVVSRDVSVLSPYAAVSGYVSQGHERTAKVDLEDEIAAGVQATLGLAVNVRMLRLGAEYNLARVPGYSIKIAVGR